MRRSSMLLVAIAATSISGSARPAAASQPLVLVLEADAAFAAQLKTQLISAAGRLKLKLRAIDLMLADLQIATGCPAISDTCLTHIGNTIRADRLLLAVARRHGERLTLEFSLFDVVRGRVTKRHAIELPISSPEQAEALEAALAKLFAIKRRVKQLFPVQRYGRMRINATTPFVEVSLNGQPRGAPPLDLQRLPPGRYRVTAFRGGYAPWEKTVSVRENQVTDLEIELIQLQREPTSTFLDSVRAPTWIVAAVGTATLTTAAIFGTQVISRQNRYDTNPGETPEDLAQMQKLRDDGQRDAVVANVLFAVGAAAMVAAGVMAYIDYRQATEPLEGSAPPPSRSKLRVLPAGVDFQLSF
ncbi:MAG: PEGA domain-containing protein [Deltaproteobacteria bacterium]|nr:PEGA domain-containing protein [Deltaproteobacteria bacterium]